MPMSLEIPAMRMTIGVIVAGVQAEVCQVIIAQRPDIGLFDKNLPGIGTEDAGDYAEQRRLAAARWPDDEKHFSIVRHQCHIVYRGSFAFSLAEPFA